MEQTKTAKKRTLLYIGVAALLVALVVVFAIIYANANKPVEGAKLITVQIITDDETLTKSIRTDAEYLRGALEQENLIAGTESAYGLYVLTVNGVTADEGKQQWWCFTKGGADIYTGIDDTPIADGDTFEITLTTGW